MPNQYKNKVVYGGSTLIDLTTDTVTADTLLVGRTAHTASGELIVGTFDPYPVGSVYMSTESTNPATLFGGTWQAIENRFLFGAGNWYAAGDTGGEATHTLTESELPEIEGQLISRQYFSTGTATGAFSQKNNSGNVQQFGLSNTRAAQVEFDLNFGGGQAHNNMPPYLVVYMWKRTA